MSLVYITGVSGTGKSTVRTELASRGYEAHDTDEGSFREWKNIKNGKFITGLNLAWDDASNGFRSEHVMAIKPEEVEKLKLTSEDGTIFLCGTVPNENEIWKYFDITMCLTLDETTLRHRLDTRTNNSYGKNPVELRNILEWNRLAETNYRSFGSVIIDASRPIEKVVDEILENIND